MPSLVTSKLHPRHYLRVFKYTIYVLLIVNVGLFFLDEWSAAGYLIANGSSLSDLVASFAATLDTAAWVILLLLFEFETNIISDEKIRGKVKWFLHGARVFCYCLLVYAFFGYVTKMQGLSEFELSSAADLCGLAAGSFSFMTDLDEFELIDAANCLTLMPADVLYQLTGANVFTDSASLLSAQKLAWTDVINAGDWLLVVLVLEIDIRLQLKGKLDGVILTFSKAVKAILYTILLLCAIYWVITGPLLDFWDAMLWIVAFVFIEMNMFEWQEEPIPRSDVR